MEKFNPPVFDGTNTTSESQVLSDGESLSDFDEEPSSTTNLDGNYHFDSFDEEGEKNGDVKDRGLFSDSQFNKEESLLTNIEDYSNRIRKEADQYAEASREKSKELLQEAEQKFQEAEQKLQEAEQKTQQMIQEANSLVDRIRLEAQAKGHEEGIEKGMEKYDELNQHHVDGLLKVLEELNTLRPSYHQRLEEEIVDLCYIIVKRILHTELTTNKKMILTMLRGAVSRMEGMGNIKIRVHPGEYRFLLQYKEKLSAFLEENQTISIRQDPEISLGQPFIETDYSVIDLDLQNQFDEIVKTLNTCLEERSLLFK